MSNASEKKPVQNENSPPCFKGVFFVGLVLLGVTANYFLNKEAGEDREARGRRIATEMKRLPHLAPKLASTSTPSDGK